VNTGVAEAAEAENLAGMHIEGHIPDLVRHGQVPYLPEPPCSDNPGTMSAAVVVTADLTADHHHAYLVWGGVGRLYIADYLAVAQNGDGVRDFDNFFNIMGDDDDAAVHLLNFRISASSLRRLFRERD
jgi:hypothetical protein